MEGGVAYRLGGASIGMLSAIVLGILLGLATSHIAAFVFGGAAAGFITGFMFPGAGLALFAAVAHVLAGAASVASREDHRFQLSADLEGPGEHSFLFVAFTFGVLYGSAVWLFFEALKYGIF